MIALSGLFFAALLAASPLPFQSELVFLGLMLGGWTPGVLVLVASVGNILGSCLTYALGRWLGNQRDHRWFPFSKARMVRAEAWQARSGVWVLLLSWLPGGDVIVAVAGMLKMPFLLFLALTSLAKTGRYAALGWLGSAALGV